MRYQPDVCLAVLGWVVLVAVTGCLGPSASGSAGDEKEIPLKTVYRDFFPIGAAVTAGEGSFDSLQSYPESLLGEFSSLTAENAMKPSVIQPTKGDFNWAPADRIVDYAARHGMQVRGHTLVWHNQTPQWMFLASGTRAERKAFARGNMRAHIRAVVGRYRGAVMCWDVVNEALTDGGGYRIDSPWYRAYGNESYITDAFDFAREADPDVRLFYNDYNLVVPHKRDMAIEMIETLDLKNHGLVGIGIQGHWHLDWPSIEDIEETIQIFHAMGFEIHITELDINCYGWSAEPETLAYRKFEKALARRYEEIFACFRRNADKISSITFWGVADDHTWLDYHYGNTWHEKPRKNYPLLFDVNREPKAAYRSVIRFAYDRQPVPAK